VICWHVADILEALNQLDCFHFFSKCALLLCKWCQIVYSSKNKSAFGTRGPVALRKEKRERERERERGVVDPQSSLFNSPPRDNERGSREEKGIMLLK
jgi:hypothetical protein